MMMVELTRHPSTPADAVRGISVRLRRSADGGLALTFRLDADLARVRVPAPRRPCIAHQLWEHTCFEAFVSAPEESGYYEFNFSPSGDWAAYRFEDYRRGMTRAPLGHAPAVRVDARPGRLALSATLELGGLGLLERACGLRLALAAVLEDQQGALSYWAPAHPPGKPDFHHRAGFTLELHAP